MTVIPMPTESCIMCGASAPRGSFPVAIIWKPEPLGQVPLPLSWDSTKTWCAHPVCNECHRDPAHRNRYVKGHFFYRNELERALALVDSHDLGG